VPMLVLDHWTESRIREERAISGAAHFDEVWDGVYIVSPAPNNTPQRLLSQLDRIFGAAIDDDGLGQVVQTVNVSDRSEDWVQNFRIPDLAVFLRGTSARDLETHWLGGPDFAIEILSPDDRARDKLDFYGKVGVRELLIIDRAPWGLELYSPEDAVLQLVGVSRPGSFDLLTSQVVPFSFRLVVRDERHEVEVIHSDGRRWSI
jgi:Uma2 family endonuclease